MTSGSSPPQVSPVPPGTHRPLWSVMIPTYNCATYLRETLRSVLAQAPGPDEMQIEVVDDLSTKDDPQAIVQELGAGRVTFHRHPQNLGATGNFNACIARARGQLVHILHGDDWVSPGFYAEILRLRSLQPSAALYACRNFCVDEQNVIFGVSDRLLELESGGRAAQGFYLSTPVQFCGTVITRSFYEEHGGFLPSLVHTADCEMWTRAISAKGGVVSPHVLSSYRVFAANDSGRLSQTAENIRDFERLNTILAARFPDFSTHTGRLRTAFLAKRQARHFETLGNAEAAQANWQMWRALAPLEHRLKHAIRATFGIKEQM